MEENKFVWVLIEDVCMYGESGRKFISVLSTFEKAKAKMQRLIKKHVTSDNFIFDGEGHIIGLDEFIYEYDGGDDEFELDPKFEEFFRITRGEPSLKPIEAMLNDYFGSEGDYAVDEKLRKFFATNHMILCEGNAEENGEYHLKLCDQETDLHLCIDINTFTMNDPAKFYFFRIENEFFELADYGSLDLTLLRVDLDDWMSDN